MTEKTPLQPETKQHMTRILRRSFVFLYVERLAQAFLWFGVALCFAAVFILWNGPSYMGPLMVRGFTVLWGAGLALSFGVGIAKFKWPTRAQARARIDTDLPNHPLQALEDIAAPTSPDADTDALWQEHRNRVERVVQKASVKLPHIRLSATDPYALRLVALTALMMSALFGPSFLPRASETSAQVLVAGPAWEGWVQPPAHTGKPTLYLADLPKSFSAPKSSKVTIRFYGEDKAREMRQTVSNSQEDGVATSQEFVVDKSGEIEIKGDQGKLWSVALLPDSAPAVELIGGMERAVSGEMRQAFKLSDDFGVARAELKIDLDRPAIQARFGYKVDPEPREPVRIEIPLPRKSARNDIEGLVAENLSKHPFSGLPVRISLTAWDAIDAMSTASPSVGILPGRKFFDPMAAALVDVRRELLWNRKNAPRAAQVIRAISYGQDKDSGGDHGLFLQLRAVAGLIEASGPTLSNNRVDHISQMLWDIALELEDGELSEALERLRRAQDRLAQAMRGGATPDEIAKLMQELRSASNAYIKQLAEQEKDQDTQANGGEDAREISGDQLQQLMDRIQELMTQGRMAEAQQLMQMLNELLENMQVTQGAGQGADGEAMENLQDMLREQQKLNDDTFSELQNQYDEPSDKGPSDLSDRQQALRDDLAQQGPSMGAGQNDGGVDPLDDARNSMGDAEQALRDNDLSGALDNQARAMELLRQGAQALQDQQRQNGQSQSAQSGEGQSGNQGGQDPLGRSAGNQGAGLLGDDGTNEAGSGRRQAEELADEIKRRSAQRGREAAEREYLNRLLDRF